MSGQNGIPLGSQSVQRCLQDAGVDVRIRELSESTHTARDAAAALGCPVGAIASSLLFLADGSPTLIITSGRHRVDLDILASALGVSEVVLATAKQVRKITGQAIGAVAPIGHTSDLPVVVDVALRDVGEIWAAAGTPHTVMALTFDQLTDLTGGTTETVSAE